MLALALAGVAYAAASGSGDPAPRWVVAVASAILAVWLGTLAIRALR